MPKGQGDDVTTVSEEQVRVGSWQLSVVKQVSTGYDGLVGMVDVRAAKIQLTGDVRFLNFLEGKERTGDAPLPESSVGLPRMGKL